MRALDSDFAQHIQSGTTTLAYCWRLTRTDGTIFGFTDHDLALQFEGTDFTPASGLEGGQTASKLGQQVDTSEVIGLLDVAAISERDILLGRYDGAQVETWRVNWRDVSQRHLMRVDTVGEITRVDEVFHLELRSAQHALNVAKGKVYQALCGTQLGAAPCGVNIDQAAFKTAATVTAIEGRHDVNVASLSGFDDGWFDLGHAVWTTGARHDKRDRITAQVNRTGHTTLTFSAPMSDWIEVGDTLTLYAGCDRRFATCKSKFDNTVNFRGFPHIPGRDFVLRYPRQGNSFDGRPLF